MDLDQTAPVGDGLDLHGLSKRLLKTLGKRLLIKG